MVEFAGSCVATLGSVYQDQVTMEYPLSINFVTPEAKLGHLRRPWPGPLFSAVPVFPACMSLAAIRPARSVTARRAYVRAKVGHPASSASGRLPGNMAALTNPIFLGRL